MYSLTLHITFSVSLFMIWGYFQVFTNCVHGYDCVCNVDTNGIKLTQKFVHGTGFPV